MGWANSALAAPVVSREVYFQTHTDSCAIACVAMAVNRVTGSRPTERAIMNAVTHSADGLAFRPQGGYVPAAHDLARVVTGGPPDPLTHNTTRVGTLATSLPAYLTAYRITSTYQSSELATRDAIWDCTPIRPVIAKVKLQTGGNSHFILIDGFWPVNTQPTNSGQWNLIICDPVLRIGAGTSSYYELPDLQVVYATGETKHWKIGSQSRSIQSRELCRGERTAAVPQ
jgi:hypothetical protein